MDRQKRTEILDDKKARLTERLDAHISALELLDATTSFDFDIATDITPKLIDNMTQEGVDTLKLWQSLYDGLADSPKYTVIKRFEIDLKPGCHGFGQKAEYDISDAWIRIYKDLDPSAIKFMRNEAGAAQVFIDHPSTILRTLDRRSMEMEQVDDEVLFLGSPSTEAPRQPGAKEYQNTPEVLFFPDLPELMIGSGAITRSVSMGQYLPIRFDEYTKFEKSTDPRFTSTK